MNKRFKLLLLAVSALVFNLSSSLLAQSPYAFLYEGLAFKMPVIAPPVFATRESDLSKIGGKGDGIFLNSTIINKEIRSLSNQGGGRLIVPKGVWLTGPITFLSNVNLHLDEGAVLLFSPDVSLYPLIETSFEGLSTKRCLAPLNAVGAENIAITGFGTIDGSGDAWRFVKKSKMTDGQWKSLLNNGGVLNAKGDEWYPNAGAMKGAELSRGNFNVPNVSNDAEWEEIKMWLRPVLLSFSRCKNVFLQGVTFQNSPSWNLHPNMCENVILDRVSVRNPWYSQNGDGLDLESCTNAIVYNSTFDVGDDAICIKSGKDEEGRRRAMPCQNVIIDGCTVFHGHGGFVVGSEMSGGVRNISVRNCQFLGTDVGLRFKSTRGRGGVVEKIYIDNVNMINIPTEPLLFDLFYGGKSASEELEDGDVKVEPKKEPITEKTPIFRDIYIRNVVCNGARRAMFFNGLPEMSIQNVLIENCSITSEIGAELSEVEGVTIKNVQIVPETGAALKLNNARNLTIDGFKAPVKANAIVRTGNNNKSITIINSTVK